MMVETIKDKILNTCKIIRRDEGGIVAECGGSFDKSLPTTGPKLFHARDIKQEATPENMQKFIEKYELE